MGSITAPVPKVWLITGCSGGFGAAIVHEALSRGDQVIATARVLSKLTPLKAAGASVLELDVTWPLPLLKDTVDAAFALHGRIDYLVNNAGYALQGTLEELTPAETQAQFDANVFGQLNVTRAVLPHMRAARSGVVANISSLAAWGGFPGFGHYAASKWAISGFSESLRGELAEFGVAVCCVEPGYFRSRFLRPGTNRRVGGRGNVIADYEGTPARRVAGMMDQVDGNQPGDVARGATAIVDVLSRKDGREVPLRLALGSDAYDTIRLKCEETLALLREWRDVSTSTDADDLVIR